MVRRKNNWNDQPKEFKEPKQAGIDYSNTVFLEKQKDGVVVKTYKFKNKTSHNNVINSVKARRNTLWYASVILQDGKYFASPLHVIDFDSVPDTAMSIDTWKGELVCPFCDKVVSSPQGRTLHVQSSHSERLGEYEKALEALRNTLILNKNNEPIKPITASLPYGETEEPDVISTDDLSSDHKANLEVLNQIPPLEIKQQTFYNCPYCDFKATSTPGRTMHVKSKHPSQFEEYKATK